MRSSNRKVQSRSKRNGVLSIMAIMPAESLPNCRSPSRSYVTVVVVVSVVAVVVEVALAPVKAIEW
eukprot:754263-Pyramimonas_sp.AAC.1